MRKCMYGLCVYTYIYVCACNASCLTIYFTRVTIAVVVYCIFGFVLYYLKFFFVSNYLLSPRLPRAHMRAFASRFAFAAILLAINPFLLLRFARI